MMREFGPRWAMGLKGQEGEGGEADDMGERDGEEKGQGEVKLCDRLWWSRTGQEEEFEGREWEVCEGGDFSGTRVLEGMFIGNEDELSTDDQDREESEVEADTAGGRSEIEVESEEEVEVQEEDRDSDIEIIDGPPFLDPLRPPPTLPAPAIQDVTPLQPINGSSPSQTVRTPTSPIGPRAQPQAVVSFARPSLSPSQSRAQIPFAPQSQYRPIAPAPAPIQVSPPSPVGASVSVTVEQRPDTTVTISPSQMQIQTLATASMTALPPSPSSPFHLSQLQNLQTHQRQDSFGSTTSISIGGNQVPLQLDYHSGFGHPYTEGKQTEYRHEHGLQEPWSPSGEEMYPHETINPSLINPVSNPSPEADQTGTEPDADVDMSAPYISEQEQGHGQHAYYPADPADGFADSHGPKQSDMNGPYGYGLMYSYTQPLAQTTEHSAARANSPGMNSESSKSQGKKKKVKAIFHRTKTGQERIERERALSQSQQSHHSQSPVQRVQALAGPSSWDGDDGASTSSKAGAWEVKRRAGTPGQEDSDEEDEEDDDEMGLEEVDEDDEDYVPTGSARVKKAKVDKGKGRAREVDMDEDDGASIVVMRRVQSARVSGSGHVGREANVYESRTIKSISATIEIYCHQCRTKKKTKQMRCINEKCGKHFCPQCIYSRCVLSFNSKHFFYSLSLTQADPVLRNISAH